MRSRLPFLGILLIPIICYAMKKYDNKSEFDREIPQPVSSVQIVPSSMMDGDESLRKRDLLKITQMKHQGYIYLDSPNARNLMAIKDHAKQEIEEFKNISDPYDTHLKSGLSDIKLAFVYKPPKSLNDLNVLGFAPAGSWKDGWTSVVEFFHDNELGTCSYTTYNLKLTGMGIKINADAVTYLINNKPTTFQVEGSEKSGFRYLVGWTDENFDNDLVCAKMTYDKQQIDKMILLGNKIDIDK